MKKDKRHNVSVVIPIYKPEEKVLNKVREMLNKQTIKVEIIENWNMPEAKSMNTGIKKAKGEIIITLAQDCVPIGEKWVENLIKPLEDKKIVVSISDLILPKWYWKKYPLIARILTARELGIRGTGMDCRACAYRKRDLIKVGLFNEDPNVVAIDADLCSKFRKIGEIINSKCNVFHLHPLTNSKEIKLLYNYAEGSGKLIRRYFIKEEAFWNRILRATPFLGLFPIFYVFPYKKIPLLFPFYVLLAPVQHLIYLFGFWEGFFFSNRESSRNLEVLKEKDTNQI